MDIGWKHTFVPAPQFCHNLARPRKALETYVLSVLHRRPQENIRSRAVSVPGCWKHTFVPVPQFCHNLAQPRKALETSVLSVLHRRPQENIRSRTVSVLGHLSVSPDAGNIRSSQRRNSAAIRHSPASYRKHPFPRSPHAPATPATTSTPKNICSPKPFPSHQHLRQQSKDNTLTDAKTYVLTIGAIARDAAPCRHFPEIGHVSPAQNRAASTQSSQYSASSSRQPGSPGSTPRPQAAQKKTGSGGFSSGQPTR